MTLSLERARSRRPVTWLTLIGVLLLPVVIGGILVAALYNPAERLDNMNAAIVNNDQAVTVNDQLVPLGRQLTAGLVEGSDEIASNLNWTISNSDDAAAGLADGTYQAVVTIPENFSAAATSTAPGGTPEKATIQVSTPPDSKVVDDAITAQVTSAAATILGQQLSEVYLENVFLGFTSLGDQLGEAASGAHELAAGATTAADGANALASGSTQLASGATGLADGANQLNGGLNTIADGITASAAGASQLASGLDTAASQVNNQQLVGAAQASASFATTAASQTAALAATVGGLAQSLGGLAGDCLAAGGTQEFCDEVGAAAASAGAATTDAVTAATSAGTASGYATPAASGIQQLTSQSSAGLTEAATQTRVLSGGLTQLATGTTQSAEGAAALGSGATQLADGITQTGTGATSLADGVAQLATGTTTLANGLDQASAAVPSYTDASATNLADVVANPVTTDGLGSSLFGASAVPLLSTLALWFGGLGTFVALQAASRRALTSRAPSAVLALRGLAPAAALGAVQGLLVAGIVQLAASYDWGQWSLFAALCVVSGVAFAAVNQALVAVFGGAGRWLAALVGVLAVATGVVSTVPGVLSSIAALMPTSPAYNGMLAALTDAGGLGAAIAGLLIWSLLALVATTIAVARRRVASTRELLAASPVPA